MNTENIIKYIKDHVQADDYTLRISKRDSHATRFAQNGITQHLAGPKLDISLNVSFGSKSGSCNVNQDSEESLNFLIKTAEDIAKIAPEDPEFMASATPKNLEKVNNTSDSTDQLSPETMVDIVQKSIDKAQKLEATVSGMCEKHQIRRVMSTKNGFYAEDALSEFGHSMTLKKGSVETKVSYEAKDFAPFDLDKEFNQLAAQASALTEMKSFEPQKIAVILRPSALEELLWFMGWMMNKRQSDEGFTPFTGKQGELFFGENFNMYSTFRFPDMISRPYDSEGYANREITWVENGILKTMPTNRHWAQKTGGQASSMFNVYIPGGEASEEEMMKMVPRGLIINRFWYIRTVDNKAGELTGMTRDGVLYFEDGKVQHAVNNLRFNEIPHIATRRILAMGKSTLASSSMHLPTMLIDGFNFVDKTSF